MADMLLTAGNRITITEDMIGNTVTVALASHAADHQNGGPDEISVAGLSGLLADDQNPTAHAADHQNGGIDEISVAGLSGLLADDQNPMPHAADHSSGGADPITLNNLAGTLGISKGGTGQITAAAAFDALAPLTTEGDIIYRNATTCVRLAKGALNQILAMNAGLTAPEWITRNSPNVVSEHAGGGGLECWYYAPHGPSNGVGVISLTANQLRLIPFFAPARGGTLDRIGLNVTTGAAGATVRIGLYESTSNVNIYPSTLLNESGALSAIVGAAVQTLTLSRALTPGRLYWIAIVNSATISLRGSSQQHQILGFSNALGTAPNTYLQVAHAMGAMPNPCTAGGAFQTTVPPIGAYRFSA